MRASLAMGGDLNVLHLENPKHKVRVVRIPWLGRAMLTRDPGDSTMTADQFMMSNLTLVHRDVSGRVKDVQDCGSGLVTNIGVNMMSNDFSWAGGATLKQMNSHAIGTGGASAAASDFYLQASAGTANVSGTTNGYMTGAQSQISPNQYRTSATFTFSGAVAVTEWVLAMSNAAPFTGRSSSGTSAAAPHLTDSGAAFTTAGNGLAGWTVEVPSFPHTTAENVGGDAMGQVSTNAATTLTLLDGWLTCANGAASTPPTVSPYVVYPSIWDHKVFSVVNTAANDTITFQYTLTLQSGG